MKKGNKCPRFCNQDHIDTAICLALSDRQIFQQQKNIVQWNLDLRKPDLRKNLELRKIVGTTDFLVHKLFDLKKIF